MAITIRPCTLADLVAVRALLIETWHATYDRWLGAEMVREISSRWHSAEQLAAEVDRPGSLFLLAEAAGELAGTAFAYRTDTAVIEIGRLYIIPSRQRQGAGSALLAAVLAGFAAAQLVELDVDPRNGGAIDFYRSHGFAIVGAGEESAVASGILRLRMALALSHS